MTDHAPTPTPDEKLPAAVLALASLCDNEVPHLSVVQVHTEPDGDRTAVAGGVRIAGLVQWTPGCASPHGTPELIPAKLLRGLQGHIVGAIEPYEGFVPSIKDVITRRPSRDSFRIALNARNLIRVLRFMQAAAGRTAAVELTITAANEMVVVEPIACDYPPGIEVRAAIMPVSTRPDQQATTPPAAHAACEEGEPPHVAAADGIAPHLARIDEFCRDYMQATGVVLSLPEAVDKLLSHILDHVNVVESILEVEGEES